MNNKGLSSYSMINAMKNTHLSSKCTQIPLSKRPYFQIKPVSDYTVPDGGMLYAYRYSMSWNLSMTWYYDDSEMLIDYDEWDRVKYDDR